MRSLTVRLVAAWLIAITAGIAVTSQAEAQYFGRNKVQYREFDFEVLRTTHFDVYFYAEERGAAADVGRMAERWHARLSGLLGHTLGGRQPIILYGSPADFQQTNVIGGEIGEGTGGVTEGLKRRVVLPLAGTLAETDHVLGHELVHAFQYDMARADDDNQPGGVSLNRLPLWFVEGMAEYLSLGPVDSQTAMWVRDALRHDSLPELRKLGDPKYFPYRWGHAFWAYVGGRWGDHVVPMVFNEALRAGHDAAFEKVLGMSARDLSASWHTAIREQYGRILEATRRPAAYGRALGEAPRADRPLYASPVLSPDGRRIVFFSERDLLSVDLYLADVESGRVIRRLVSTAVDPHFSSLQFINSAGSWRPNGREFVVGALRRGQPVLAIIDVETGRTAREVSFPALGEILNPAWSPDGRRIAFSATSGGHSDLYVYELADDTLRQLTDDPYADLQPAWSPDGDRIAFVTDRFSTRLDALAVGPYGLALLDPSTGGIERVAAFDEGKSINPQWADDGRTLYFVADPFGISNVYAIEISTGRLSQVTNLDTGVSGITALSPSLSVAADARRMAFSAYDQGRPVVHVADDATVLAGGPAAGAWTDVSAAALPPERRASPDLAAALADVKTDLPAETGTPTEYHPRLTLDWVGQPYVSAGYSRFGPTFGGGLSFLWSDMLGNHTVAAAVDANTYGGRFSNLWKDTGGLMAYQNLTHRWDWGVSVEQLPYLAGGVVTGVGTIDRQPAFVDQEILERQTFRAFGGAVARPFSPARRVEFGASYQRVGFEREVRTIVSSALTGQVLSDERETSELAGPLGLASSSAALVFDSAIFGATSPVAGERSRFEVSPTVGTLSFTGALADYRRYLMPLRFYTVAARVLHYGRYGSGGEDVRLVPLFIGYPQLIRGYGIGSFSAEECTPTPTGACPEFDRLAGSRMLVANLELRFPLLRPFGVGGRMYGPLPTEVALFADGGGAWNRDERPTFFGGDRRAVSAAGVSLRVNLLGFAVAQIDLAHPFQRPTRSWVWAFSLTPGF
jgi:Tol biopolymer transport system component